MSDERYPESGDFLEEIDDQNPTPSGGAAAGLSTLLGNKGAYCTVTDECMPTCN
jgi:formiminotetrahydrofolate cyclodeaminase